MVTLNLNDDVKKRRKRKKYDARNEKRKRIKRNQIWMVKKEERCFATKKKEKERWKNKREILKNNSVYSILFHKP